MAEKSFEIPLMSPIMEPMKQDYPIAPGENLRLAFEHKKPKWMPLIDFETQWIFPAGLKDSPPGGPAGEQGDGYDWFGTFYKYSAAQSSATPAGNVFGEIGEWREKVRWPDLAANDWAEGREFFPRDPSRLSATRLPTGCFERLHAFEGFEQALMDILLEPEECKAFFERFTEHRVECIRRLQEVYHFDYLINHDDWSNKRAQFFSNEIFEFTLLDTAVITAEAIHENGAFYMPHCCGKMDVWVPYLVNDIHADALEIQTINDIRGILDQYGSKVTPMFTLDPYIMYNPATTVEQARAYAREVVDKFGAHTCDGAGVMVRMTGNNPETFYAAADEIYNYSSDKYANL